MGGKFFECDIKHILLDNYKIPWNCYTCLVNKLIKELFLYKKIAYTKIREEDLNSRFCSWRESGKAIKL